MRVTKVQKEIMLAALDIFREQYDEKKRGANKTSNEVYFNNFRKEIGEKLNCFTLKTKKQQRGIDSDVYLWLPVLDTKSIGDPDDSNDDKIAWLEYEGKFIRAPKEFLIEETKTFDLRQFCTTVAPPISFEFKTVKSSVTSKNITLSSFNNTPPQVFKEITYKVKYKGEDYKLILSVKMFYVIVNDCKKTKEIVKVFVCSGNFLNPEADHESPPSQYKVSDMNNDIAKRKIQRNQGVGKEARLRVFIEFPPIQLKNLRKDIEETGYSGLFWSFDDAVKTENGYKYNYNKISFTPKTAIETKLEEIEKKHEATN